VFRPVQIKPRNKNKSKDFIRLLAERERRRVWRRSIRDCIAAPAQVRGDAHINCRLAHEDRGGGTGGEFPMSKYAKPLAGYANNVKGGIKQIVRGEQIRSIFAVAA
jgi:hypothetical protein